MPYTPNVAVTTSQVVSPNAYRIRSIILTNHSRTREIDISGMVTDFSITESIYLHTVVLSMNVKDFSNVMETMGISGQERITITLSRKGLGKKESQESDLSHTFVVTEYPVYGKTNNRVQVYSVKGVSEHAFLSRLKRISRAKKSSTKEIIREILERDLFYRSDRITVGRETTGILEVIIPYVHPIDAISWLTRRAFDSSGSPFYCYETLEGMRIESLSEMIGKEIHRTYREEKFFTHEAQTAEDYEQRMSRILSLASDLNLSKFAAASAGAYASSTNYLDVHIKSFKVEKFNYEDAFATMSKMDVEKTISSRFTLGDDKLSLSKFSGAHVNHIPINSGVELSYNSKTLGKSINIAQSYVENLDSIVHDLTVMGDYNLHPGKMVDLVLPRAMDPGQDVTGSDLSALEPDELLSGKYLVTSVTHLFDGEYFCNIRIKKDSFSKDYFAKTAGGFGNSTGSEP
jgi:hypothetical protein